MRWDRFRSLLRTRRLGQDVRHLETVDSTSEELKRLLAQKPAVLAVVADGQTAGRGRGASTWFSPPGENLTFSLSLEAAGMEEKEIPLISAAAAVALHRALSPLVAGALTIKWPNDIYLNGRKLAGILSEIVRDAAGAPWVVMGIGLNVGTETFPPELAGKATSLRIEEGRTFDPEDLLAAVLGEIEAAVERVTSGDAAGILDEYRRRCTLWGRRAGVDGLTGTMEGISPRGGLLLRLDGGEVREILAGSVELEP
jgi:BirA family biotin operon repressor/biotin-[acetyl-CoA-carboxylase] ligase